MGRVFIIQDQKTYNQELNCAVSRDYSPSAQYGEPVFLLAEDLSPFHLPPVLERLHEILHTITHEDWIIPVGNPVLIGLACAIASDYLDGDLRMLQWQHQSRSYIPITMEDVYAES